MKPAEFFLPQYVLGSYLKYMYVVNKDWRTPPAVKLAEFFMVKMSQSRVQLGHRRVLISLVEKKSWLSEYKK